MKRQGQPQEVGKVITLCIGWPIIRVNVFDRFLSKTVPNGIFIIGFSSIVGLALEIQ